MEDQSKRETTTEDMQGAGRGEIKGIAVRKKESSKMEKRNKVNSWQKGGKSVHPSLTGAEPLLRHFGHLYEIN